MRSPRLALAAVLMLGIAFAQPPFPDVPPGHWAEPAVLEAADACIVTPFGQGDFRGDDPLTRYEVAVVAGRLLDAVARRLDDARDEPAGLTSLEGELADVAARFRSLAARVGGFGADRQALLDAFEARVVVLEAEVARLRAALDGHAASGVDPTSIDGADRASGASGASGSPRGEGLGDASLAGPAASSVAIAAPSLARPERPWSVGVALGGAPQGAPLVRVVAWRDDLLAIAGRPAGVRASLEAATGGAGARDVAFAVHLTRRTEPERFGPACWRSQAGAGGGYRLGSGGTAGTAGPFLSVLVGTETWTGEPWNFFVEAAVEIHPAAGGSGTDLQHSPVRPSLVVGVNYRF